jgi:hypothetical protein
MKVRIAVAVFSLIMLASPVLAQEPRTANTVKAPADVAGPAAPPAAS